MIKGKKGNAIKLFVALTDNIAQLSYIEKLFLYTFVLALPNRNCLEIGTAEGGSARIISLALSVVGGKLLAIDQTSNRLSIPIFEEIKHNTVFIEGTSPECLSNLTEKFDFVFIDGDHSEDGVYLDAVGVLPHLNHNAYVLFHDASVGSVKKGIDRALNAGYVDCGFICNEPTDIKGFRLCRI